MEPTPLNAPALILAALALFASDAHARPSATSWVVDHIDSLVDKIGGYLDKDAERRRELDKRRARIVPKGNQPEVIIRRTGIGASGDPSFADGILYNGQRITVTDPPSHAIKVFGPDFRVHQNHHVWDSLGISMSTETRSDGRNTKPREDYIASISIELNPPPSGQVAHEASPSQYFRGYLSLDGAGIDRMTKIWELRALADRSGLRGAHPYIICLERQTVCEFMNHSSESRDNVWFWTDKDHANGKIYSVTYRYE